jgi:hypothetical protein
MSRALIIAAVMLAAGRAWASDCAGAYERAQERRIEGRLGAARAELHGCVRASCPAFIRHDCRQWLDEVVTLMPTVVLLARIDGKDAPGVTVRRDDEGKPMAIDGRAMPVDPGKHRFVFEAPGTRAATIEVMVDEGEKNQVVEAELTSIPATDAKAPSEGPTPAPEGKTPARPADNVSAPAKVPPSKAVEAPAHSTTSQPSPAAGEVVKSSFVQPAHRTPASSAAASEPPPPVADPFPTESEGSSWMGRHRTSIVMAGLGAGGLALFGVMASSGLNRERQLAATCAPWCRGDDVAAVRDKYLLADVGIGIGAISLALSVYSYYRETHASTGTTNLSLNIGPRGDRAVLVVSSRY